MTGGGSKTVVKHNPYDDRWIKNWQKDAERKYINSSAGIRGLQHVHKSYTKPSIDRLSRASTKANKRLDELGRFNQARIRDIRGLGSDISGLRRSYSDLEKIVNKPTTTGDVKGLDSIISKLRSQYSGASTQIKNLGKDLSRTEASIRGDTKTQLNKAISDLGINQYLKTSDFNTRMSENLGALGDTLRGEFGADIAALDLPGVRDAIADAQGDIGSLTEDFAGLSSDMDWIKKLDLEGFDDRLTAQGETLRDEFSGDLTDLRSILESGRGEALANLEAQLGKDRAADILQLKQDIESGRASEIEALAGNLRQEYGDQIFDLSNTFDERMSGLQSDLGGDISSLFQQQAGLRGDLEGGLATLTSGLGTTSQQLEALRDSFGDYQTQAASNLGDVRSALESEIGDLSGSLTSGLADLQTDYLDRILGSERAGATARDELRSDLTGAIGDEAAARQSGLATEASAREAGLSEAAQARSDLGTALRGEASSALQDVYQTREQAISELSGRFGENLRAQEESLGRRIDDQSRSIDEKIGRLGSMMNYRMLGDSAGGVKMRRSKAYTSGAINTGTGQLSRTMKLKTLNI